MSTDTSEKGLERLIVAALTGLPSAAGLGAGAVHEQGTPYLGAGYVCGDPADYDRAYAVDRAKLLAFSRPPSQS